MYDSDLVSCKQQLLTSAAAAIDVGILTHMIHISNQFLQNTADIKQQDLTSAASKVRMSPTPCNPLKNGT
jgi:hypothetical protein